MRNKNVSVLHWFWWTGDLCELTNVCFVKNLLTLSLDYNSISKYLFSQHLSLQLPLSHTQHTHYTHIVLIYRLNIDAWVLYFWCSRKIHLVFLNSSHNISDQTLEKKNMFFVQFVPLHKLINDFFFSQPPVRARCYRWEPYTLRAICNALNAIRWFRKSMFSL